MGRTEQSRGVLNSLQDALPQGLGCPATVVPVAAGLAAWEGQEPEASAGLLLCSYSNVFSSTEQKLHCSVRTFHEPPGFYQKPSLNDSFDLPGSLASPFECLRESERGHCHPISAALGVSENQGSDVVAATSEGSCSKDGWVQEEVLPVGGRAEALAVAERNRLRPHPTARPFAPSAPVGSFDFSGCCEF